MLAEQFEAELRREPCRPDRVGGEGTDWNWTVKIGSAECSTMITFGGLHCQFTYSRGVRFPDSPQGCSAMTWEEYIDECLPRWDLMTADTIDADLELFFTFGREMEQRIRRFLLSAI